MAQNQHKAKHTEAQREIKAFNPTKSKVGKVIIVILALGMFLATLLAAIINIIDSFKSLG